MDIYQIKISLLDFKPTIYRRVLLPSTTLLPELHTIIQAVMGWDNSHLHHFTKNRLFSFPVYEDGFDEPDFDYYTTKISDLLSQPNQRCRYEYDFGDSWLHEIVLEKVLPLDKSLTYPICIKGRMNGPIEDCGGVYGYQHLKEVFATPKHKEFRTMTEWIDGIWDFEHFDLDEINQRLKDKLASNPPTKS